MYDFSEVSKSPVGGISNKGGISPKSCLVLSDFYLNKDERLEFTENLFGQEVSISLERDGQTIVSSNFRAPVRLTQFDVANSSPVSPSVDIRWIPIAKSVNINWNADPLNENGLVLKITSQGDKHNVPKTGSKETQS